MFDGILTAWVEEVERFVENEYLWTKQHCCHDANFLLIAGTKCANEFLLSGQLVGHEVLILSEELMQLVNGGIC